MRDCSPSPLDMTKTVLPSNVCSARKSSFSAPSMGTRFQVWPPSLERTMVPCDPLAHTTVLLRCTTTAIPRRFASTLVGSTFHQVYVAATASKTQVTTTRMKKSVAGLPDYFFGMAVEITLRASGCLGLQSSGGKVTRQKLGRGMENSKPTSALPERTGPRNTTEHSCSSSVPLCCICTLL